MEGQEALSEGGAGGATPRSPQDGGAVTAGPRAGRLGGLLQDLLAARGRLRTSELLGVSERTLQRAEAEGRLTEQLCRTLERYEAGLLESREQPVDTVDNAQELARLRRRLDKLERVQQAVSDDLPEVPEALARLEASVGDLQQRVAALEHGGDGGDGGRPAGLVGASARATSTGLTASTASTRSSSRATRAPHRRYPELVTVEAEAEEERFYGAAMEDIVQWRLARLRREQVAATTGKTDRTGKMGKTGATLERLRADERLLELEQALVGEHGLTLPPADRPWDGIRRQSELRVLDQAIGRLRRDRRGAQLAHWSLRLLTLGLWGRRRG